MIGLETWINNFTQFSRVPLSPEALADIPHPYVEYAIFGAFKAAELASIIGGCIVHPIYRFYLRRQLTPETTTNNSFKIIRNRCRRIQGRFLLGGLFFGPVAAFSYLKWKGLTEREVKDRCYKIRCDHENMVLDRVCVAFGLVGWYWKRFQGAVDGINIGVAYALFNNKVLEKYTYPMLRDKIGESERFDTVEEAEAKRNLIQQLIAKKADQIRATQENELWSSGKLAAKDRIE
ncbi:hypothetical protein AB6A40_001375 [Gnathostoma spinigerum]|uniref:Uncharacterized protein n=1 Tax=Gnathostoma spinigerum TaxID=75299 RepID=A0ABD6EB75_9BILA